MQGLQSPLRVSAAMRAPVLCGGMTVQRRQAARQQQRGLSVAARLAGSSRWRHTPRRSYASSAASSSHELPEAQPTEGAKSASGAGGEEDPAGAAPTQSTAVSPSTGPGVGGQDIVVRDGEGEEEEEMRLTVDPNTAHTKQVAAYAEYKEYMKSLQSEDRMDRRRALIAQMSDAELLRRTQRYGAWGDMITLNPENRWVGMVQEIRVPSRFRTVRATTTRVFAHGLSVFLGMYLTLLLLASKWTDALNYTSQYYIDRADLSPSLRGFGYDGGEMSYELGMLHYMPSALVEGEPDLQEERPPMFRFSRILDEFRNASKAAELRETAKAAAEE